MFKSNTVVQKFYFITILLSMLTLTYGIWHYWNNGSANIENISRVFDASEKLQQLKKKDALLNVTKLIDTDQVRIAVRDIDVLEKGVKELSFLSGNSEDSQILLNDIDEVKTVFTKLISYPRLTKIINVLSTKINSFENFVIKENWRTLTRISKRLKANIESKSSGRLSYYTVSRMSRLIKNIKKDVSLMSSVTNKSYLSINEKSLINTKIGALLVEVIMFDKYISELKKIKAPIKALKSSHANWLTSVEPAITFRMIEFERDSKKILFSLLGLLLFMGITLLVGTYISTRVQDFESKHVEDIIIDTIKDGLISTKSSFAHNFTVDFERELAKYKDYVHKRMSFGSVFRDALPFSTLMLDSNLHTVWANKNFYDLFGFSNTRENDSPLTWDFVNKFTNLGEDDPVMLALKKDLAGIYQVQIRPNNSREEVSSSPYEMYVSPVDYGGEKRIVIFLYPLDSLEQTLQEQMKSVVGPVSRMLDAMNKNIFDANFRENIKNDFRIAGIDNIYDDFIRYNSQKDIHLNSLNNEIRNLEGDASDQYKLINDLNKMLSSQSEAVSSIKKSFKDTKDNIIAMVENKAEVELIVDTEQIQSNKIIKHDKELLKEYKVLNDNIGQFQSSINQLLTIKNGFAETKQEVENFKLNILQVVDQALILQKVEQMDERISQLLTRIKLEVRSIDNIFSGLSRSSTQFDMIFSKLELISKEFNVLSITESESALTEYVKIYEHLVQDANQLCNMGRALDEKTVNTIKQLFNGFRKNDNQLIRMKELVDLHLLHSNPQITNQL
jgi:hypothetical protein